MIQKNKKSIHDTIHDLTTILLGSVVGSHNQVVIGFELGCGSIIHLFFIKNPIWILAFSLSLSLSLIFLTSPHS